MTLRLPSERAAFKGFEAFAVESIEPFLKEKETARAQTVVNVTILGAAFAAFGMALAAFGPFGEDNIQAAAFIAIGGWALCGWLLNRTRTDISHGLIELIAGRLGFTYRGAISRPDYHERFRALKLLPNHNREAWEDEIVGTHSGASFVICEANLKYKSSGKNSSTRTVFHGQLLSIDYPKRFLGRTVLLRDAGPLNALGKPGAEFSRVGLASPEFEKAYEAWSTDQVEARDLLDPLVLERFQELERLYQGKKLRAAFDQGRLLIAIETGDRLNMGSMFKSLNDPKRVETILAEFDVIFDLIDALVKQVEGRMETAFSIDNVRRA